MIKKTVRSILLVLFILLSLPSESYPDDKIVEKRFESLYKCFVSDWNSVRGLSHPYLILDYASDDIEEILRLGVSIVPYIVEKIRLSQDIRLPVRTALIVMADALLLNKTVESDELRKLHSKIFGKAWALVDTKKWLKWWEEEGRKLYEKRLKEVEKEKKSKKEKRLTLTREELMALQVSVASDPDKKEYLLGERVRFVVDIKLPKNHKMESFIVRATFPNKETPVRLKQIASTRFEYIPSDDPGIGMMSVYLYHRSAPQIWIAKGRKWIYVVPPPLGVLEPLKGTFMPTHTLAGNKKYFTIDVRNIGRGEVVLSPDTRLEFLDGMGVCKFSVRLAERMVIIKKNEVRELSFERAELPPTMPHGTYKVQLLAVTTRGYTAKTVTEERLTIVPDVFVVDSPVVARGNCDFLDIEVVKGGKLTFGGKEEPYTRPKFADEGPIKERFEALFKAFDRDYKRCCLFSETVYYLLTAFPYASEFVELGLEIVPFLVEKIDTYEDKHHDLLRNSLIYIATTIILNEKSPAESQKVAEIIDRCAEKRKVSPTLWLRWWEKEGKKLYEKRLKEYLKNAKPPESEPPLPAEEPAPLSLEPIEWTELPRIPPSTPPEFVVKEVPEHKPVSRLKPEVEQPKTPIFVLVVTLIVIIAILIALFYTYFRR